VETWNEDVMLTFGTLTGRRGTRQSDECQ